MFCSQCIYISLLLKLKKSYVHFQLSGFKFFKTVPNNKDKLILVSKIYRPKEGAND